MNQLYKQIISILCIFLLSACASEEEKVERRENSYDLSGEYKVSAAQGSEIEFNLIIQNESGRHDIVAFVERFSTMTEKEMNLLKVQGIDPQVVSNHFKKTLILGKGKNKGNLDGGENISTDFGESSQFYVCTPQFQYNPEYTINYCLSGTATRATQALKGQLTLNWIRSRKVQVDGVETQEVTTSRADLAYKTDMSMIFYKQYLGKWSGETHSLTPDFSHQLFKQMMISEEAGNLFQVNPVGVTTINFRGEVFRFEQRLSQFNLELLKRPDYPAIQMSFVGNRGNRIVVVGQIWSLGDFTGSILLVTPQVQIDLATFKLKKN